MKSRKHHRVAKREVEVKNVQRTLRKERKVILGVIFFIFAVVWLEGFLIGSLLCKKASRNISCV